jgi:cytoskeletal protein CcmA (bactofilin family)
MWATGKSQPEVVTGQEEITFLGKGVVFRGSITLEGKVRIDGQIEGEVYSTGTLTVGEHAVIKGNITTGTLITSGKIKGAVIASEKITILRPGILIGDIRTPAISIEAGAVFHGQSDMSATMQSEGQAEPDGKIHDLADYRKGLRAPDS